MSNVHSNTASPLRFAITGASGFIGNHLIDRLLLDGMDITAISRRGTGRADVDDVQLDYSDANALQQALQGSDFVVHLAARAHQLDEAADNPALGDMYWNANVNTTLAVAAAARAAGVRRLVLISSIGVNGNATHGTPFRISDKINPAEPYAKSKWIAEQELARCLGEGLTDYVILRPPLVYGPRCPGNFERLLAMVAHAPLLPLGGIRTPRTLIHVANLVDAIIVAAKEISLSRRTFLVTDARDTSVSEIVAIAASAMQRPKHTVITVPPNLLAFGAKLAGKTRAWEKLSSALQVDGTDFRAAAGWRAPVDPADGIRETAMSYLQEQDPTSKRRLNLP